MGVRDKQLVRIRGSERAPKWTDPLRAERRAWGGGQAPVGANAEAVDGRRAAAGTDAGSNEVSAVAAEQDVAGQRVIRQGIGRIRDRAKVAAAIEREARVVAAAGSGIGHVDEVAGDRQAERGRAVRLGRLDQIERTIVLDPENRDVVARGVDGQDVAPIRRELDGAGRADWSADSDSAGRER